MYGAQYIGANDSYALDSAQDNKLVFAVAEDLTGDRQLDFVVGDANRKIDLTPTADHGLMYDLASTTWKSKDIVDTLVTIFKTDGSRSVTGQLVSTYAAGAPLVVADATVVANLNADLLDGNHASAFALAAHTHTFLVLTDVPASYVGESLKLVRVNAGETALEFTAPVTTTFLALTDAPATYAGQASKVLMVNVGETAVEFLGPWLDQDVRAAAQPTFGGLTVDGSVAFTSCSSFSISDSPGNCAITLDGTLSVGSTCNIVGLFTANNQIVSTLADGGAMPINVTSLVKCVKLNADLLDGLHAAAFVLSAGFTAGSVLFSSGPDIAEDNSNFFWDDTNKRLGIGINSGMPAQAGLSVSGEIDVLHTASNNDDHAIEIDIDAAGFGDVKAIDIEYETGAISAGEDEAVLLIDINEFNATGGDVFGVEVLATSGGADNIFAIKAGAVVGPILQESGTFENPTTGTNNTPSTDVAAMIDGSTGTNTTIFVADNDYILIGADDPFTEMEFNIETPANNPGIKPTFGYSIAGSHLFTTFSPVDGTDGFRHSGVIAWDAADLTAHAVNTDTGTFDIKIARTHAVAGSVSLFFAKTAATVVYSWDKDGNVLVNKYLLGNANQYLHASSSTFVALNAVTSINFDIGGSVEAAISANALSFANGLIPTGLNWGTNAKLFVTVDGIPKVGFTAATFEPVTDNAIDEGKSSRRFKRNYCKAVNPSHATNPTVVVADMWYNQATKTHRMKADDGIHNIVGAEALTTSDDAVSNTTTETLFTDTKDIAADSLVIGAAYEWWAWGKEAHSGTPIFTFRFRLDAVVVVSGAFTASGGGGGWKLHGHFTVRSIGASGTVQGNAEIGDTARGSNPVLQVSPVTVDTTQILTAGVSVQMSAASPFNVATLQQFIVKKVS